MFLITCSNKTEQLVRDEKRRFVDIPYDDMMTRNLYDNFSVLWGKDGAMDVLKHLAQGKLIGVEKGFECRWRSPRSGKPFNRRVYCFHSYFTQDEQRRIRGYGIRIFFDYEALKDFSSLVDKSKNWGEPVND